MTKAGLIFLAAALMSAGLSESRNLTRQQACEIIDNTGHDVVCGLWKIGGDGATIAVLPQQGKMSTFDIVLIESPDMSVIPGEVIGELSSTGRPGVYDSSFYGKKGPVNHVVRYIMTIDKSGRMELTNYKKGKKVALWRWLPYLFRFSVTDRNTRPSGVDGAVKVYPPTTTSSMLVL